MFKRILVGLLLVVSLPIICQNVSAASRNRLSRCGLLALFDPGKGPAEVWDPKTGETWSTTGFDPLIGQWNETPTLSGSRGRLLNPTLFGPNGSWVSLGRIAIAGLPFREAPELVSARTISAEFQLLGWRDAYTLDVYFYRTGELAIWDTRQQNPVNLNRAPLVADSGPLAFSGVINSNGEQRWLFRTDERTVYGGASLVGQLVDPATYNAEPLPDYLLDPTAVVRNKSSVLRTRKRNGVFEITERVDSPQGSKTRVVFRSQKEFFRQLLGESQLWAEFVKSKQSRLINTQTGLSITLKPPTDKSLEWQTAFALNEYAVFLAYRPVFPVVLDPNNRPEVLVVAGSKQHRRIGKGAIAQYGPSCDSKQPVIFTDNTRPFNFDWTIRPFGSDGCLGGDSSSLQIRTAPATECLRLASGQRSEIATADDGFGVVFSQPSEDRCLRWNATVEKCEAFEDKWNVSDPSYPKKNRYINPQGSFPMWFVRDGTAQCLTRTNNEHNANVFIAPCDDVSPMQLWR
jgi:hypothetical protein